jgi:hypothetical protein
MRIPRVVLFLAAAFVPVANSRVCPAATPSADFSTYVLFAAEELTTKGLTVLDGNLGVNAGMLQIRRQLDAPRSEVVSRLIDFEPPAGTCHVKELFANRVDADSPCGPGTPFPPPIFSFDLTSICLSPGSPIVCTPGAESVFVAPGERLTLPPGTYGEVVVRGSSAETGTLVFAGGEYTLCNLRSTRQSHLEFSAPTTVRVASQVKIGDRSYTGPTPGTALKAGEIRFLVAGDLLSFRQRAEVHAVLCAPSGRVHLGSRVTLEGQVAGRQVRSDRDVVLGLSGSLSNPPGSTTTTTVTTTTTSTRFVCGNGVREGTEICDAPDFGNATCPDSSVVGAFLECRDACSRIDFNGCPDSGSSTTSTSLVPTTTTTSTTVPPLCGNGVVESGERCDPPDFGGTTCPGTDSNDQLRCSADCTGIDASECPPATPEVCGNCIDDDGNGTIDFEDPACCAQLRTFRMAVSRARIIPQTGSSRLKLRANLARAGLARVDPSAQDLVLQVKPQQGSEVLCAQVPAGRFIARGKTFRFTDKLAAVESARGITRMTVRIRGDGSVVFVATGKQVRIGAAQEGPFQVTVGFRGGGALAGENRCSTTTQSFRASRRGGLLAP